MTTDSIRVEFSATFDGRAVLDIDFPATLAQEARKDLARDLAYCKLAGDFDRWVVNHTKL